MCVCACMCVCVCVCVCVCMCVQTDSIHATLDMSIQIFNLTVSIPSLCGRFPPTNPMLISTT